MASTMKREREWDAQTGGNKSVKEDPVPTVNPYTAMPYSQKFYDIFAKRKGACLPCCALLADPHAEHIHKQGTWRPFQPLQCYITA